MHASLTAETCSGPNANIISLAEYRSRRLGGPDGNAPSPGPGALGARPFVLSPRVDATGQWFGTQANSFFADRRMCHAAL